MGEVYKANQALIHDYPEKEADVSNAVVTPARVITSVKVASMTRDEVERLVLKLDMMTLDVSPIIQKIVAESVNPIITAVRMVKDETKESFMGIQGSGAELDIDWLRPQDVGGVLLNPAATGSKGLWSGTSAAVLTWLHQYTTGGTAETLVPSQIMSEEAGMIYLGFINPIEIPLEDSVTITVSGQTTPRQSLCSLSFKPVTESKALGVMRLEKPVIVGPEKTQAVTVEPMTSSAYTRLQPLALLISKAESLTQ